VCPSHKREGLHGRAVAGGQQPSLALEVQTVDTVRCVALAPSGLLLAVALASIVKIFRLSMKVTKTSPGLPRAAAGCRGLPPPCFVTMWAGRHRMRGFSAVWCTSFARRQRMRWPLPPERACCWPSLPP
jgi:hypothetical protein